MGVGGGGRISSRGGRWGGVGGGQDIEQAMGVGGGGRISSRQWGRWGGVGYQGNGGRWGGAGYRAGNGGRWGGGISVI